MPRISFSAPAVVYTGNPHEENEVHDPAVFQQLHGVHSGEQLCSEHIDQQLVKSLGLCGGRMRFAFDPETGQFQITTTYGLDRKPDAAELHRLLQQTEAQWSDGIGSSEFGCFRDETMSATLGKALLNQDPEVEYLTEYFVEAYPLIDNRETAVMWSDEGGPDDFLIHDLREGVEEGNADAQTALASLYWEGDGVEQDLETAVALLTRSAEQEEEVGMMMLADALLAGMGIEKNPELAIGLLEKSCALGSPLAIARLADVYKQGDGVPAQPEKAIPLLEMAAEVGFLPAIAELGDCYEFGYGVDVDLDKARQLYESCMAAGFEDVAPALKRVNRPINPPELESPIDKPGGILGIFKRKKNK